MKLKRAIQKINEYIQGCYVQPSLQREHLTGAGAVYQLEKKLAVYYSKKYAVAFSNATAGLSALCIALELKRSEIIAPPFSWGGGISPFLSCGTKIVFSSVEETSLNIAPENLSSELSSKTRAILSVDFNGNPANSKLVKEFCTQHGLFYISDTAQGMGAYCNDKPAGYYADAIVLSFGPGKALFGGEGGAILTNNEKLYEQLLWVSQHPERQKTVFGLSHYNEFASLNGRLHPIAAILLYETFELSMKALTKHQVKYFDCVKQLQAGNIILVPDGLQNAHNSTYFNPVFQLSKKVALDGVNHFIERNDIPVTIEKAIPRCIPFDKMFRKQFLGKYRASSNLLRQKVALENTQWIKLTAKN